MKYYFMHFYVFKKNEFGNAFKGDVCVGGGLPPTHLGSHRQVFNYLPIKNKIFNFLTRRKGFFHSNRFEKKEKND